MILRAAGKAVKACKRSLSWKVWRAARRALRGWQFDSASSLLEAL